MIEFNLARSRDNIHMITLGLALKDKIGVHTRNPYRGEILYPSNKRVSLIKSTVECNQSITVWHGQESSSGTRAWKVSILCNNLICGQVSHEGLILLQSSE